MSKSHNHILGLPRIGARRELKRALESYWKGELNQAALQQVGQEVRASNRALQRQAGLSLITVGDFAWYDQVLSTSVMLGVVPPRFTVSAEAEVSIDDMFRMARGRAPSGEPAPACEMTKWFDTNYHFIVPELYPDTSFRLANTELFTQVDEAIAEGGDIKVVLLGPLTWLHLAKVREGDLAAYALLPELLSVYSQILERLKQQGVSWVQFDEPILALDLDPKVLDYFTQAYNQLAACGIKLMLASYFGPLGDNVAKVLSLPVQALHLDWVRGAAEGNTIAKQLPAEMALSCGIVEGRNIWRNNLRASLQTLTDLQQNLGDRLMVASACSLLHAPVDVKYEHQLDPEIKQWLAFAVQKTHEVGILTKGLRQGEQAIAKELEESDRLVQSRSTSKVIHNHKVQQAVAAIDSSMLHRASPYAKRAVVQAQRLGLPLFPTTTIGSFPQTDAIRRVRRQYKQGEESAESYTLAMQDEIRAAIARQEQIGLDVLVHGEPERNDMVEYFGEQLEGFSFSANGWVQSYGSRCVKPPIIYGDVSRPAPITVPWSKFAQSLSDKPVKGMLTGPVTILCWSFVRDDLPRKDITRQIALALRGEVLDLEKSGINIIQIDEPAIREGMPLRQQDAVSYLQWAVECFHLAADGVRDHTQIHTHMCYCEFNDIMDSVAALDADVISIEASRSNLELLDAFERFDYPNEIGPGVYDIHSPNVPDRDWIVEVLRKASRRIPKERLWINPDCGLKTRAWEETTAALTAMVEAARILRDRDTENTHATS